MENIQPLKLGQVFSFSFKLFGKDFWKMFLSNAVCTFILLIPIAVIVVNMLLDPTRIFMGINPRTFKPENPFSVFLLPEILIPYIIIFMLAFLLSPFMNGIPLVLSSSRLHGRPLKFKEAFLQVGQKYGRLLVTGISGFLLILPLLALYFLLYFGMMNSMFSGFYRNDFQSMGGTMMLMPLMSLFSIVYSAAMIYLGLVLQYSACITINEDKFAFPAIFRGFELVGKSGFWRNIGHYVILLLCIFGATFAVALILMIFSLAMFISPIIMPVFLLIFIIVLFAFEGITQSFSSVYVQIMYFNARIVREGYGFSG